MLAVASCAVLGLLLAGSLVLRVGAAEGSYRQVVVFSEALGYVLDKYVDPLDAEPLLRGAYEAMLTSLDPESAYLTAEEIAHWDRAIAEGEADPGLSLLKIPGSLMVVAVAPGSPAAQAGLEPGDQVRLIEGQRAGELSLVQAHVWLRGAPGTRVQLEVLHPHRNFERERLVLDRVRRSDPPFALEVGEDVAVLRIHDLARLPSSASALKEALASVYPWRGERLLVDLRGETRGSVADALALLESFVQGPVLWLRDRAGATVRVAEIGGERWRWPGAVAVLVNGACAGGAEAVAAVLRSERGAVVYGERTYGMGAEVDRIALPDGAALVLATSRWESRQGSWHGQGLAPDVEVRGGSGPDAGEEQLRRAMELFGNAAKAAKDAA